MKKNSKNKKIISSLIILSMLIMPFSYLSFAKKAEAQTANLNGYISGLAPAIAQLPLCQKLASNGIKKLFSSGGSMINKVDSGWGSGDTNAEDDQVPYGDNGTDSGLPAGGTVDTGGGGGSDIGGPSAINNKNNFWDKIKNFIGIPKAYAIGDSLNLLNTVNTGLNDQSSLPDMVNDTLNSVNSVQTTNPTLEKDVKGLKAQATDTNTAVNSLNANDTCLKSIGRLVIKMLIQKMTLSTVNWINSGFNGGPAFVQDPGKFFGDIAKNEILGFGAEINASGNPFGKAFMQNLATGYNQKFADNAQYTLDKMIAQTNPDCKDKKGNRVSCDIAFNADFSQGGWGAWEAMTQVPANNPLGFQLMASNELGKRLEGTVQSSAQLAQATLQEGNGFLGDNRCVDPTTGAPDYSITEQKKNEALKAGQPDPCLAKGEKWAYVTPGEMVSHAALGAYDYQKDALVNAQDLNDAMAAIIDALLNQFNNKVIQKGFTGLSDFADANGNLQMDTSVSNDYGTSQVGLDFSNPSTWLQQNPNFNIRTDLNQALIDTQKAYSDKLTEQNKELFSTTDKNPYKLNGTSSNAYGLVPTIYQLDYCIPGPHPGWENDSMNALSAAEATIPSKTKDDMSGKSGADVASMAGAVAPMAGAAVGGAVLTGAVLGSTIPGLGTAIGAAAGLVVAFLIPVVQGWFTTGDDKVASFYALIFRQYTGIKEQTSGNGNKIDTPKAFTSKEEVISILNTIFSRYIDIINDVYTNDKKPLVYKEAENEYNKVQAYGQMIKDNDTKVTFLKQTINELGDLKNGIDTLNGQLASGQIDQTGYENALKPYIQTFNSVSMNMVSGDDIASADSILKQIVDEKNYDYNVLLKGPTGCEKDLEIGHGSPGFSWMIYDTKRMTYPFPILYDYNKFVYGGPFPNPHPQLLPDPFNSGYKNYMNSWTGVNEGEPGFLPYTNFETKGDTSCSGRLHCPLQTNDLIETDTWSAGISKGASIGGTASYDGAFEKMIGIY